MRTIVSAGLVQRLAISILVLALSAGFISAQSSSPSAEAPATSPLPAPTPLASTSALPDSSKLEVVYAPKPDYPLDAALKRLQGKVLIKLHISENGDVKEAEIVSGESILAEAAADSMKTWKFKPFIKDGKPVNVNYTMPFIFSLKGYFPDGCAVASAASAANTQNELAKFAVHHQVSGQLVEGRLIHRVDPEYPGIARANHLQGTVLLYAVIGEDGGIRDLKAICGHPVLIAASLEAVRQWRYRPYEQNGAPVAVKTTIRVEFRM